MKKKIFALAMAMTMMLALAACGPKNNGSASGSTAGSGSAAGSNPAAVQTIVEGKLTVSTNASFPPYEMVAGDGTLEGIDMEVAAKIAEKLGLEVQIDDMGYDACLQAAQTGKSDMVMAGVSITPERQEKMDFSDTYANAVQVVIVKEDSPIATLDDLANAEMIGCQVGTTGYIYCSDTPENGGYGEDHVTAYKDGAIAIQALMSGKIDAVVIDNLPAQEYVKANPGLKILETEFANENYAIGFAKGNTQLVEAVNAALAELTEDGTVQQIIDKYIPAK